MLKFSIFRYNSEDPSNKSFMQPYELPKNWINGNMVLDALIAIQERLDPSLAFRKACREGVCGSDGMNINGKNSLACILPLNSLRSDTIVIKPLPGMPVIKDLIVDLSKFFAEYEKIQPYLQNAQIPPAQERLQSIEQRARLDGLYECVLCACCSSACQVYLENSEEFIGPAAMLQAARFIMDNRDSKAMERIDQLDKAKSLFKCTNLLSCIDGCPKGLDPNMAINEIHKKALE